MGHMAGHDPLTDLPNRTLFREQMEHALSSVRRDEQLAVFFILDHFKQVDDDFGHSVGDDLLKAVARRLRECVRGTDTIARLGGDEFAVVQVGTHSQPTEAALLASRLVDVISAPYDLDDQRVVIGASVGVSIAAGDRSECDELMKMRTVHFIARKRMAAERIVSLKRRWTPAPGHADYSSLSCELH